MFLGIGDRKQEWFREEQEEEEEEEEEEGLFKADAVGLLTVCSE